MRALVVLVLVMGCSEHRTYLPTLSCATERWMDDHGHIHEVPLRSVEARQCFAKEFTEMARYGMDKDMRSIVQSAVGENATTLHTEWSMCGPIAVEGSHDVEKSYGFKRVECSDGSQTWTADIR